MALNISGDLVVGKVTPKQPVSRNVKDLIASGNITVGVSVPAQPAIRNIRELIADQLEAQAAEEAARKIEEQEVLPVDSNRPIFNSIIDRKENSRYMLDLVKV